MAHTPGPWVVGPIDDTAVTHLGKDGIRYEVAAVDGDYNDPDEWPIMEANARLIAAAPDLLAVVKAMVVEYCDYTIINNLGNPETQHNIKLARAAIAKAEGAQE